MGYNYRAVSGSTKISARNQGGGDKLAGLVSTTNISRWAAVAYKNRNVLCGCNRNVIFCVNQLGGVGAGGVPGRSYMFAPGAGGVRKTEQCGKKYVKPVGNTNNQFYGFSSVPQKTFA